MRLLPDVDPVYQIDPGFNHILWTPCTSPAAGDCNLNEIIPSTERDEDGDSHPPDFQTVTQISVGLKDEEIFEILLKK